MAQTQRCWFRPGRSVASSSECRHFPSTFTPSEPVGLLVPEAFASRYSIELWHGRSKPPRRYPGSSKIDAAVRMSGHHVPRARQPARLQSTNARRHTRAPRQPISFRTSTVVASSRPQAPWTLLAQQPRASRDRYPVTREAPRPHHYQPPRWRRERHCRHVSYKASLRLRRT